MIVRAVTSFDVADNSKLVTRLKSYYNIIDSSFKPFSAIFPWLPGPSTFRKLWASTNIFRTFKNEISQRKGSGIRRRDALQQFLDAGESDMSVTAVRPTFLLLLPFAHGSYCDD